MFIIIIFWLSSDTDFFFFAPVLLSILMPLFLPSSVFLSYFILAVPKRECLGKHSCMSSTFPMRGEIVITLAEASRIKI